MAAVALFLLLIAKLVVAWQLHDHPLLREGGVPDTTAYVRLAREVVSGNIGLGPGLYYVSPLYIYFVAAGLAVGSLSTVLIVQAILGTVAVALIALTARSWFGDRAGGIAGALAAFTGLFTFYESVVLQAAIDPFLTALELWSLTTALKRSVPAWWVVTGCMFGIHALNRPHIGIAALGVLVVVAVARRWQPALLLAAGLLLGTTPVAIRNVVVSGQWSLASSHGGLNLLIGNGEGANGLFRALPGIAPTIEGQARDTRRVAEQALGRSLTDNEVSSYFTGLALQWIREHPAAWVRLMLTKLRYAVSREHIALPLSYPFYAYDVPSLLRWLFVGPWLLLPLGFAGLLIARPADGRSDFLIWASFVPAYAASVLLFFVTERYRLPLLVPLVVTSAALIEGFIRALAERHSRRMAVMAGISAGLAIITSWPTGLLDADGRGEERLRMAVDVASRGQTAEAERWLPLALQTYPYSSLAEYRVGVALGNAQQWDPAAAHLRKAIAADPDAPRLHLALGQVLASGGHDAEAVSHLRRAVDSDPALALHREDLAIAIGNTGDRLGALDALRGLKPPPDTSVDKLLGLGRLAMELQGPDVAGGFLAQAVSLAPQFGPAHEQLGLALLWAGRNREAAEHFQRALQLEPRSPNALAGLAQTEAAQGRSASALEYADAALRLDPNQPIAKNIKARGGR